MLAVDPHPLLDVAVVASTFPHPLAEIATPPDLRALAAPGAPFPLAPPDDALRRAIRDLLRHGGFKPSGRSKPCTEYLRAVAEKGALPAIDPVVDATNVACLHGGLPISTVDADRVIPPLRIGVAPPGSRYTFNASGQEIDVGGLLCLFDAAGPCANAVKDAQRTKTRASTIRTLTVVWGSRALPGRTAAVASWLRDTFEGLGGEVAIPVTPASH